MVLRSISCLICRNTTGNKHTGLGGGDFGNVAAFTDPPYDYDLDNAKDIPSIVQKGAGPQDAM